MRISILLFMLLFCLKMCGQEDIKYNNIDLKAVESAYNILKEKYYPSVELCVADSIYDLSWWFFLDEVDEDTKQNIMSDSLVELRIQIFINEKVAHIANF